MTNSKATVEIAPVDEIIDFADIVKSKRGRTKVLNQALITLLKGIPEGKGIKLEGTFGKVPAGDQRAKVSGEIRKHYLEVYGVLPSINYTPDGVAQVFRSKKAGESAS